MPWQASEASSFTKKADTPEKKRQWAKVANSVLKQTGSEAKAIKAANAACEREEEDSMDDRRRRRRGQSRDPQGRELETWEELEEINSSPLAIIVNGPSATALRMYDAVALDESAKLQITRDGYLKALPRIARTGIQLYKGDECGRGDVDIVRVYRPESSVFHNDATHSYTHLPITIEHPGGAVTADNWRKYAVGETGDEVLRDGGSVRVPMMLRDAKAIELVKSGKRELSVGYGCELDWNPGVTPDGEPYDAVQHNIRGNHLAIVTHARGGSTLRIGDSKMTDLKTVLIDGLPCQMSDKDAAIVMKTIKELQDQNEFFKKKIGKKEEEEEEVEKNSKAKDEAIKTKDALILTLQQQLKDAMDPARRDAELADRDLVRNKARALMGSTFKVDGKEIADMRREVVLAKSGVQSAKDWGDTEIKAVFEHLTADVKQRDPINDARTAFAGGNDAMQSPKAVAYQEMVKDMENAWRSPS